MTNKRPKAKVMVFGVFDFLHQGHLSFLRQAKRPGHKLVVSVARDANVFEAKGHLPVFPEKERLAALQNLDFVDQAVLGGLNNPWAHVLDQKPDIIALGYDQNPYLASDIPKFKKALRERGLKTDIVRLKAHKTSQYKTNKIRKILGRVKKHLGRGTRLGFPTANLDVKKEIPDGIYLAVTTIAKQRLPSILFIGPAITFGETKRKAEVYILDYNGNLNGQQIEVELLRFLRPNKKFKSAQALIAQMKKDQALARKFFASYNIEK